MILKNSFHHVVDVDDRHIGQQLVIGDGSFRARIRIRDDRERRHLGARSGRGRYRQTRLPQNV